MTSMETPAENEGRIPQTVEEFRGYANHDSERKVNMKRAGLEIVGVGWLLRLFLAIVVVPGPDPGKKSWGSRGSRGSRP